jgi:hypothetical protein
MKREFLPYYLSRAAISLIFGGLIFGLTWKAALLAAVMFALFLLYLHSGWFRVDPSRPLTPLRRDDRGQQVQRKALIAAVVVGGLVYAVSSLASSLVGFPPVAGLLALAFAVIIYFIAQFVLLSRS